MTINMFSLLSSVTKKGKNLCFFRHLRNKIKIYIAGNRPCRKRRLFRHKIPTFLHRNQYCHYWQFSSPPWQQSVIGSFLSPLFFPALEKWNIFLWKLFIFPPPSLSSPSEISKEGSLRVYWLSKLLLCALMSGGEAEKIPPLFVLYRKAQQPKPDKCLVAFCMAFLNPVS